MRVVSFNILVLILSSYFVVDVNPLHLFSSVTAVKEADKNGEHEQESEAGVVKVS